MMDFNIMRIRAFGDMSDPYFYPVIDKEGQFLIEQNDHSAATISFNNVKIQRGATTVFESEHGLDGKLFVTDSRVVLLCEDYQSGGIVWVGGLAGAVLASAASDAMARSRTSGTALTGHIRYEWLDQVAAKSEKFLPGLFDETLIFTYNGSGASAWTAIVSLKNDRGAAERIGSEITRRLALFNQEEFDSSGRVKEINRLPAIPATQSSQVQYCTQCGGKIRALDAYCKHCGAKQ